MTIRVCDLSDLVIDTTDKCFEWQGSLAGRGYGIKWLRPSKGTTPVYVHRFVYELCYGTIPEGHVIHHKCENKRCANPLHLEVLTQRENILQGPAVSAKNARKRKCPKCGEAYTPGPNGRRECRPCRLSYMRAYYHSHKETRDPRE